MVGLIARVAAIELVVAAQAIDLRRAAGGAGGRGDINLGHGTDRAYRMVRELVPFIHAGDTLPHDLEPVVGLVTRGDPASGLELPVDQPG
jgi:histidine ammonia-lyase